jgi:predicted Rossmann fold flavoprotein
MEHTSILIIGGGASGLYLASQLAKKRSFILLERGDRVGKKLAATGGGWGNVTNLRVDKTHYLSVAGESDALAAVLNAHTNEDVLAFLQSLGGLFSADRRGRVYPTGRQASAVTDLFRAHLKTAGADIRTGAFVKNLQKRGDLFVADVEQGGKIMQISADNVVLCAGGKVAKNFGTDGNSYVLASGLGHSVTKTYPALVQLKTDPALIKGLKGIRVFDALVSAKVGGERVATTQGDVLFTDYGISGDAAFFLSSYLTAENGEKQVEIDLLPNVSKQTLEACLNEKLQSGGFERDELFCGILNNQVGRCVMKSQKGENPALLAAAAKAFTLPVLGTLGFDNAQVTKGGVPLAEVDERLQSKKQKGLYFAGEILDVDGECGGYNLQWAFSSAWTVANALIDND